jgi:hypothetical protein
MEARSVAALRRIARNGRLTVVRVGARDAGADLGGIRVVDIDLAETLDTV